MPLLARAWIGAARARRRWGRTEPAVDPIGLLRSAARNLELAGTATDLDRPIIPYDQFAISFAIDSSGLALGGLCEGAKGTIVHRGETALLAESGTARRPMVALVRTLVPMSELQVPATRESNWLIDHLPVPSVMPPAGERPQGKVRLSPSQGPEARGQGPG